MRFSRVGMLAAAFFLTTLAASAQIETTPQQWTIVTTKESAPNAFPLLGCERESVSLQRTERRQSKRFEFQLLQPARHHHGLDAHE